MVSHLCALHSSKSLSSPRSSELARGGDADGRAGGAALRADGLDLLDDVQALGHGAEDDVLAVESVGLDRAEEEPA